MPRFDTVVKNGMIIDGTRAPRYRGDIGIKDGRITEIGELDAGKGANEIDASGLIGATRAAGPSGGLPGRSRRPGNLQRCDGRRNLLQPGTWPRPEQYGVHTNADGHRGSLSRSERARDAPRTEPASAAFSGAGL